MFWGTIDSSIQFCEDKYSDVVWIAEYYNTISSFAYVLAALPFVYTKIQKVAKCGVMVGLGSVLFHCTLRQYGQWVDEISMLCIIHYILMEQSRFISEKLLIPIVYLYIQGSSQFWIFFIYFASVKIYLLINAYKSNYWMRCYSVLFVLGFICWLMDQFLCKYVKQYQLHAWWHICTGLSTFFAYKGFLMNKEIKKE